MKKRLMAIILTLVMCLSLLPTAAFAGESKAAEISTAEQLAAAITDGGSYVLTQDIDMSGKTANPPANGQINLSIDGAGYTISNWSTTMQGLFAHHTGSTKYAFKNITLKDCSVASTSNYAALFVGDADTADEVVIDNCHVQDCTVSSAKYAAAFIAYTAGYNKPNDGPVYSDISITNCSASGGSITGGGSTGVAIGHSGGNPDTASNIANLSIENIAINGEDAAHTGIVVGTAHIGKTMVDDVTVGEGVTGNYGSDHDLYGRFVSSDSGDLLIDGTPVAGSHSVAIIGTVMYKSLDEALKNAQDNDVIKLLWNEGNAPISMNGSVYGKTVTITGTAQVDWTKGYLFVGRGGSGDGTLIFDKANLTTVNDNDSAPKSTGIHVSGREKDTSNKYDGTLIIKDSSIVLDYLINRGTIEVIGNGTVGETPNLVVKGGFGIAGRPADETEDGKQATATIDLKDGAYVKILNPNGMGIGCASGSPEGFGIMNIDSTSKVETASPNALMVYANVGTLNSAGDIFGKFTAEENATVSFTSGTYTFDPTDYVADKCKATDNGNDTWTVSHKLTKTAPNAATCTTAGNTEYYTCDFCGEYFSDAEGTKSIEKDSWVINALGHEYGTPTYEWNGQECTATRTCTACAESVSDHSETETVTGIYVKDTAATCTTAETGHYKAEFTNEAFDAQQTTADSVTNGKALGHTWADATCTAPKTCSVCHTTEGAALDHSYGKWTETKAPTCTSKGMETRTCTRCKTPQTRDVKALGHTTKTTTTKATLKANGEIVYKCSCGKTMQSTKTIYMPKTFTLSHTQFTENGRIKIPVVTIKDSKGNVLKEGTDYTVTYATGRKAVGTYKVTIKGIGKYSFTKTLTFKINPAATKIVSAANVATKSIKVTWNKAAGASTYEVQYVTGASTKSVKTTKLTATLSKLTKGKTYKVRVRGYKKDANGNLYYSAWTAYKSVKVAK